MKTAFRVLNENGNLKMITVSGKAKTVNGSMKKWGYKPTKQGAIIDALTTAPERAKEIMELA